MFFKTAYAAAKLGLKEGDQVTRKTYREQDRAGYTPTEGLEKIVPAAEMEERDWIVVRQADCQRPFTYSSQHQSRSRQGHYAG